MQSIFQCRRFLMVSILLCLWIGSVVVGEPVSPERARKVAETFLLARVQRSAGSAQTRGVKAAQATATADLREICDADGTVLAYVTLLSPQGFVVTSADTNASPIVAYSLQSPFPSEADDRHPLVRLLKEDIRCRTKAAATGLSATEQTGAQWEQYTVGVAGEGDGFQQWPADGATTTGGWVETTWHQDAPFNDFCPFDPVDGARSYVGCVATAMAQLVHYHQQCNVTLDEYDAYTTYSGIDIDGDSERYDFPSFEELNTYLADVRLKYSRQIDLNDVDIAALNFACGVSTYMDYSSEGSGASPYDLQDALVYMFGFDSAQMTGGLTNEYLPAMQENLANGLPVLLGMSPADGMGGHVVVCDGYNTDGEYHLNFGWGAPYPDDITEAWYCLPTGLPSYLSAVQEILLDIRPVPESVDVDPGSLLFQAAWEQQAEPKTLFVRNNTAASLAINSISSPDGFVVSLSDSDYADRIEGFEIARAGQEVAVNVKFDPETAGSYYGMLVIEYGNGQTRYIVLQGTSVAGGTEIEAGAVSGTWSLDQSPYYVLGDIEVETDAELVIEPGVEVYFMGPYGLTVDEDAQLVAEGTAAAPIRFTAGNQQVGWKGLRFIDTEDDDVLRYCSVTYGNKGGGLSTSYYGSENSEADSCGGALYCYNSCPTISHCKFTNNIGDRAGAIYCVDSDPEISNTLIANNASLGDYPQGGGICCEGDSALQINNCTIANNAPGGIFSASYYRTEVTNSIVWGNSGYQVESYESVATVSFSDVQDGYPGEGNIEADPCFFDPSGGAGVDYDGLAANWALQSCSPVINVGTRTGLMDFDLAGNTRVYSDCVDLGAYENQSDLPLLTIIPGGTVDTGTVQLETTETTMLGITNSGKIEFTIESLSVSDDANGVFSLETPVSDQVLAPGESVGVQVNFTPAGEEIYTGTLRVRSTSSNAADKLVPLRGVGITGTIVPAGEVDGTWTQAESPYMVTGDIEIPRGQELTIEPGVTVKFTGHFRFTAGYRATLTAEGTEEAPIVFTAVDTDEGWFGLRFVDADDDDVLRYCTIEYAKKHYDGGSDLLDLMGGGIICCYGTDLYATYTPSSPTIDHCVIAHNHGAYGGGILCTDDSEMQITHCQIVDNSTDTYGGGIWVYYGMPTISHCVIARNDAAVGGGISNYLGMPIITNNTIVRNRPNALELDHAMWSYWSSDISTITNNIIWENEVFLWDESYAEDYDIRYNNVQGGYDGEGNIDVDPCFADPDNGDFHLKSQAGRWDPTMLDWVVDEESSPCIDAGDPDEATGEETDPHGDVVNLGAYGGTSEASKTP